MPKSDTKGFCSICTQTSVPVLHPRWQRRLLEWYVQKTLTHNLEMKNVTSDVSFFFRRTRGRVPGLFYSNFDESIVCDDSYFTRIRKDVTHNRETDKICFQEYALTKRKRLRHLLAYLHRTTWNSTLRRIFRTAKTCSCQTIIISPLKAWHVCHSKKICTSHAEIIWKIVCNLGSTKEQAPRIIRLDPKSYTFVNMHMHPSRRAEIGHHNSVTLLHSVTNMIIHSYCTARATKAGESHDLF